MSVIQFTVGDEAPLLPSSLVRAIGLHSVHICMLPSVTHSVKRHLSLSRLLRIILSIGCLFWHLWGA